MPMDPDAAEAEREEARRSLRERGAELLRRSADVNLEEDSHPAYTRILDDLAPDEARILRLLNEEGPQPSVDIRSGVLPLQSTSELVAAGLNMIGSEAGCRHLDDVPAYLNNLFRLGSDLVLARAHARSEELPGARGAARGRRGAGVRRATPAPSAGASTSPPSAVTSASSACVSPDETPSR